MDLASKRGFPINEVVRELNWFLTGWSNDFKTGHPVIALRFIPAVIPFHDHNHDFRRVFL